MKLVTFIFALITLSVVVKCNLIAAVARPVLLSIGTIWAALNQDVVDIGQIDISNFRPNHKSKPFTNNVKNGRNGGRGFSK